MDYEKVIVKQIETLERVNEILLLQVENFHECAGMIAENARTIKELVSFFK